MERTGYAQFVCTRCSNHWSSAKANIMFYYPAKNEPLGKIGIRLFGQK
ncbi:unnamed protein product, partial [Rotaria sp. Silwood1]